MGIYYRERDVINAGACRILYFKLFKRTINSYRKLFTELAALGLRLFYYLLLFVSNYLFNIQLSLIIRTEANF